MRKAGDGQTAAEHVKEEGGSKEKQEMMEKARAPTQPNAKDFKRTGEREVYDPVTGRNVIVKDAKLEGERVLICTLCFLWTDPFFDQTRLSKP